MTLSIFLNLIICFISFSIHRQSQAVIADKIPTPMNSEKRPSIDKNDSIEKALTELSMADADPKLNISSNLSDLIAATSCVGANTSAPTVPALAPAASSTASVPPSSVNIETFYKEVQRYEKIVNGLTTKTLNGTTPLEIKWKELNDLLEKDASKRTASISKLFPEKNRNMLSVPYDHSRVLLPTETDNYINAAHIRVSEHLTRSIILNLFLNVINIFTRILVFIVVLIIIFKKRKEPI